MNIMISYKGNEDKLHELNPFYRWKNLDRKLQFSKETKAFTYQRMYKLIPFERMGYGDSVFVRLSLIYWHKIKREARRDPKIKIIYDNTDKRNGGVRIWNMIVPTPKLKRPIRIYKLAA